MIYNILKTGSGGNSIIYHDSIMVDIGIPYKTLEEYKNRLQIILLTHSHADHFNLSTIKKLQAERPTIRIGVCEWMVDKIKGLRNIDIYEIGKLYDYKTFQLSPFKLYHDVENCGYRIFKDDYKIFHATDTAHLKGITAKGYDLYALEHNYCEEKAEEIMRNASLNGEFSHLFGSVKTHLSEQKAKDWIYRNKSIFSEVIRLHESSTAL